MKITILNIMALLGLSLMMSCDDELELVIPYNDDDINLNELTLPADFTHIVPDGGFASGSIHFNTVRAADGQLEAGFAYSNRSNRSFTWGNSTAALDTNRYSVFTAKPNRTGTYAVAKVRANDTYFTLAAQSFIEHILVGNTTYTYLALNYGDQYGTVGAPVSNPNIPNTNLKGVWYSYVPGGVKTMNTTDKDYFRLIATGFNGNTQTGSLKFDLACRGSNPDNPTWNYVVDDWYKFSLEELGTVDRVVFTMESSDVDGMGNIRTPQWFCVDGIRLKK
jgi:hypothetical protein